MTHSHSHNQDWIYCRYRFIFFFLFHTHSWHLLHFMNYDLRPCYVLCMSADAHNTTVDDKQYSVESTLARVEHHILNISCYVYFYLFFSMSAILSSLWDTSFLTCCGTFYLRPHAHLCLRLQLCLCHHRHRHLVELHSKSPNAPTVNPMRPLIHTSFFTHPHSLAPFCLKFHLQLHTYPHPSQRQRHSLYSFHLTSRVH